MKILFKWAVIFFSLCLAQVQLIWAKPSTEGSQKTYKRYTGHIKSCEFIELGTWGFKFFVGMEFKEAKSPYIRFNISHLEQPKYKKWCDDKEFVSVHYRIKHTAEKDHLTNWGEQIQVKNKHH
ncbi:MAG: hypothetical protein R3E90_07705 [Marinicella sp.]